MNGRRVVFVVGCPRSGTTLVQQLLNAHPEIRIGPETHFIHRFWQQRDRFGDLRGDGWSRLVREVAAIPELADIGVTPDEVVAEAEGLERHPGRLLLTLLDRFGSGAAVTGEKTPNHLLYMPLLQEWIPGARFIHVLRDPRAVANSWRTVPWSSGTVFGDAAIWRRYLRTARRNPPRPGTLLVVRYEELVEHPADELRRMARFLELPYDERMLEHHRSGSVAVDVEREPWKRRVAEPISAGPASRWRQELTRREVFEVEATVGGLMERVGYPASTRRAPRLLAGPVLRAVAAARRFLSRGALPAATGREPGGAAADGRGRPRVLFVSSSSPLPATRGGNQRTNLLLRALMDVADVDLVYLHWELDPLPPDLEARLQSEFALKAVLRPRGGPEGGRARRLLWKVRALARAQAERLGVPGPLYARDRGASDAVRRLLSTGPYDAVVARYLLTVAATRPFGAAPVIVDADDFEITRYRAMSTAPGAPFSQRIAGRLAAVSMGRRVSGLLLRCAHVWVPSEVERQDVKGVPATVLPNIPFTSPPESPPPAPDSATILLVASLRYSVNQRSVERFVREIWPRVRGQCPEAAVRIVGAGMSPASRQAWGALDGVEPIGYVDDLGAEYARCLFTVAPIFHGGGTKIKVLESLAHRRACVVTTHVHRGFGDELPAGTVLTVADSPATFADRCVELLTDPEQARRQADQGVEIVRNRFSFDRFAGVVERTLGEVHQ